jgi:putative ABC transport system substrate-binding protein
MVIGMRRRDLILGLGGAAAWPLGARAQQHAKRMVGFLYSTAPSLPATIPGELFRQALNEAGYVEGQNVSFEQRSADGRYDRLPGLAADLVRQPVDVIVAVVLPAVQAAKATTTTIPIVFWAGGDAVVDGLVASFSRPGGNLTGVSMLNNVLGAKRLELLHELVPKAAVFAMLVNPTNPNAEPQAKDVQEAARRKGVQIHILGASTDSEIEIAFAKLVNLRTNALIVASDGYLASRVDRLVALAAQYAVPAIYTIRRYAAAGGLISYTSSAPMDYQLGSYTGRILNGEKPADLPVIRPTKFELVINLKTAKALGLTVPQSILARADEVIE